MTNQLEFERNVIELILTEKPDKFTALILSKLYSDIMHERVNWHDFSAALDRLYNLGILKVHSHMNDGMTVYQLK